MAEFFIARRGLRNVALASSQNRESLAAPDRRDIVDRGGLHDDPSESPSRALGARRRTFGTRSYLTPLRAVALIGIGGRA